MGSDTELSASANRERRATCVGDRRGACEPANFDAFAERFGWDHSEWDDIEAVQVAENGVNVAMTFSRYNADDEVISTFNTLYLVTNEHGRWGIRSRSSFAP